MKKRILSVIMILVLILSLCSCKQSKTDVQNASQSASSENESNRHGVLRPNGTSSQSLRRPVFRPTEVTDNKNLEVSKTQGLGAFMFSPETIGFYGDSMEDRLAEFEDVLSSGCFNTVILSREYISDIRIWVICRKYFVSVWYSLDDYFDSSKININTYLAEIEKDLQKVKTNISYWDNFMGFYHNQNIKRGQKNKDFLLQTRGLYYKFNKRSFAAFDISELTGVYKNTRLSVEKADSAGKIHPDSLDFVTDITCLAPNYDVRENASFEEGVFDASGEFEGITDAKTFYSKLTERVVGIVGHNVNVWLVSSAGAKPGIGSEEGNSTEGFCMAQLLYMKSLLSKQKFRGGILLDGYIMQDTSLSLNKLLVLKDVEGEQLIYPDIAKWEDFSDMLRNTTAENKKTLSVLAEDFFYGVDLPQSTGRPR